VHQLVQLMVHQLVQLMVHQLVWLMVRQLVRVQLALLMDRRRVCEWACGGGACGVLLLIGLK
jgi:hypothetical protein